MYHILFLFMVLDDEDISLNNSRRANSSPLDDDISVLDSVVDALRESTGLINNDRSHTGNMSTTNHIHTDVTSASNHNGSKTKEPFDIRLNEERCNNNNEPKCFDGVPDRNIGVMRNNATPPLQVSSDPDSAGSGEQKDDDWSYPAGESRERRDSGVGSSLTRTSG